MNYLTDFKDYFWLRKSKPLVSGKVPIYLRIERRGQRKDISTRLACWEFDWDYDQKCLYPHASESLSINSDLNQWRLIVHQCLQKLSENPRVSLEEVHREIFKKERSSGTLEFVDNRIMELQDLEGNGYRHSTIANYKACRRHIAEFLRYKSQNADYPLRLVDTFF